MLIRSQDKKKILQCRNFLILKPTRKKPSWGVASITTEGDYFVVADYSTEEKAIKVMDLVEEQILGRNDKSSDLYRNTIFQFPPDEDVKE